jgi:hypothetical protein
LFNVEHRDVKLFASSDKTFATIKAKERKWKEKKLKNSKSSKNPWASGTGYGVGSFDGEFVAGVEESISINVQMANLAERNKQQSAIITTWSTVVQFLRRMQPMDASSKRRTERTERTERKERIERKVKSD